ncbi:MAG TPA: hypothetical protein VFK39_07345 [Gemmatimonadaceae bacterium]|nr:hypothetical protein [Gemmatimonadaceae bacterium]
MTGTGRRASAIRLATIAAAIVATAALACTKVGTEPSAAVAIESFAPPLPSVVVGDTMRDSAGNAAPLRATVYNSDGDPIPDAPIHFLALDSLHRITLDTTTGIVVGRDTGQTRIVAHVGSLQSQPVTLTVVLPPTAIIALDSLVDTLHYTIDFTTGRDTLQNLRVRLVHVAGSDTIPVPSYLVSYNFLYPAGYDNSDSTKVQLVNGASRKPSLLVTTGADGSTSQALRITPFATPDTDSVIVAARAAQPGGPSTPIRFVVHYTIQVPQ